MNFGVGISWTARGLIVVTVTISLLFLLPYRRHAHILKLEATQLCTALSSVLAVLHIDDVSGFRFAFFFRSLLSLEFMNFSIGEFAKLRKATMSFVMPGMSLCPHGITRF